MDNSYTGLFRNIKISDAVSSMAKHYGPMELVKAVSITMTQEQDNARAKLLSALRAYGNTIGMSTDVVEQIVGAFTPKVSVKKPFNIAKDAATALSNWEFESLYDDRLCESPLCTVNLVGQEYRGQAAIDLVKHKSLSNMVLFVAEPTNPIDHFSVMVMMWAHLEKTWVHVGYVKAEQAKILRSIWPEDDTRNVLVGDISAKPVGYTGHRADQNIQLTCSGEYRKYPAYNKAWQAL